MFVGPAGLNAVFTLAWQNYQLVMAKTIVLITIDTEYSSGAYVAGHGRDVDANYRRSIGCGIGQRAVGIAHQMALMDQAGIRGTFFVDPMPALVWGQDAIDRVIHPILEAGHDVQLHCHAEWLALAPGNELSDHIGRNIKDFPLADQQRILAYGAATLQRAGTPRPVAFRAGNYGANDDTLRALAAIEIAYDSSFPAGLAGECDIGAAMGDCRPHEREGVIEVPIGAILEPSGGYRHAQVTSVSAQEMAAGIKHAARHDWPAFVMVSHSFELFDRKRGVPNRIVARRFAQLCDTIARMNGIDTRGTFADLTVGEPIAPLPLLPAARLRTARRYAEQALSNAMYG